MADLPSKTTVNFGTATVNVAIAARRLADQLTIDELARHDWKYAGRHTPYFSLKTKKELIEHLISEHRLPKQFFLYKLSKERLIGIHRVAASLVGDFIRATRSKPPLNYPVEEFAHNDGHESRFLKVRRVWQSLTLTIGMAERDER